MSTLGALVDAASEVHRGELPVLVFRTTVNTRGQVILLSPALSALLGPARWSFDLEDRDHVLRIEHEPSVRDEIITLLHREGYMCAELD